MMKHYDPVRALTTLIEHKVRFVLIGGLASRAHGSPTITNDLDICYERSSENLLRLVEALKVLGATLRGAPEGLPFLLDSETLRRGDHFTFLTDAGPLDILGTAGGLGGVAAPLRTEPSAPEAANPLKKDGGLGGVAAPLRTEPSAPEAANPPKSKTGSLGFDELMRTASEMDFDGLKVWVATLDDLIDMKTAAGRPKDRVEVEILGALREEIDEQRKQSRN